MLETKAEPLRQAGRMPQKTVEHFDVRFIRLSWWRDAQRQYIADYKAALSQAPDLA